jgi:peptidoglycan hydrolase-like protein with peptidoglycan-binding domain
MTDVFIAYAREDRERVRPLAEALQTEGWDVWWDPSTPSGPEGAADDAKLTASSVVLVVWSAHARASDHVRAEAAAGLYANKLVQVRIDQPPPPRPFDQVEVIDLSLWPGGREDPSWRSLSVAVRYMVGEPGDVREPLPSKILRKPSYVQKRSLRLTPILAVLLAGALGAGAWYVDPLNWRGLRPSADKPETVAGPGGSVQAADAPELSTPGLAPEEEFAWIQVDRSDPVAVRGFLDQFPDGGGAEAARSLLRVLDAQAWVEAVTADTEAAYTAYLSAYPQTAKTPGTMVAEANKRIAELGEEREQALAYIQEGLKEAGLYRGAIDGRAGDGTARAVRTFAAQSNTGAPDLATAAPRDLRRFGDAVARSAGGPAPSQAETASSAAADQRRLEQAQAAAAVATVQNARVARPAVVGQADAVAPAEAAADALARDQLAAAERAAQAARPRPEPFATAQLAASLRAPVEVARRAQQTANARAAEARSTAQQADAAAEAARNGAAGAAVITAPDGDRYETQIANNTPNGLGVRTSGDAASNGDKYRGQLRAGLGQGLGVYEFASNPNNAAAGAQRYEGEHAGDAASGFGVMSWRSGDRFAGEDRGGGTARGVLTFADGSRYEGELLNGARHGLGVFWSEAGEVRMAGRWENGQLVEPVRADAP